jgi:organic hydroperoxide reductase OsmC/OhrA
LVESPGRGDGAKALIQAAKKHCIVANSLKYGVDLVASVEALSAAHSP